MTDVVVIGGIFIERLPSGGAYVDRVGGSGFVAALTAAALGAQVTLVSFVGEQHERALFAPLRRAGVDTSAVSVMPGASGMFSFADTVDVRAPRPGYRPAGATPIPEQLSTSVPSAPVVLAFGFPDFDPQACIAAAVQAGGTLMWDRQGWLSRDIDRLALVDLPIDRCIYVANAEEMRHAANRSSYAEALREQPAAGFDAALIKCGRWGTVALDNDRVEFVEAFAATTVSAIGSGDSFGGAVASRLAAGDALGDAARVGAAASSLFVSRRSNIPARRLSEGLDEVLRVGRRRAVNPAALERIVVYLAGPWFTAGESLLIDELEAVLDHLGVDVVSPRRDIGELAREADPGSVLDVGRRDYAAIEEANLILAVLDGNDPGTLMEVGYAAKASKPIIGLNSNMDGAPQPMREAAGVRAVSTVHELVDEVTQWVRERYGIG